MVSNDKRCVTRNWCGGARLLTSFREGEQEKGEFEAASLVSKQANKTKSEKRFGVIVLVLKKEAYGA